LNVRRMKFDRGDRGALKGVTGGGSNEVVGEGARSPSGWEELSNWSCLLLQSAFRLNHTFHEDSKRCVRHSADYA